MQRTYRDELAINDRALEIEVPADRAEFARSRAAQSWNVLQNRRYDDVLLSKLWNLLQRHLGEPTTWTKANKSGQMTE